MSLSFAQFTLLAHCLASACTLTLILPHILDSFAGFKIKALNLQLKPSPPLPADGSSRFSRVARGSSLPRLPHQ